MTDEAQKRNPVTKLLAILNAAKSSGQLTARAAWGEVFNIDKVHSDAGLFEVLEHLIALRGLFDETITLLRQIPIVNEELHLHPVVRLRKVVNLNGLHEGWVKYTPILQTYDMFSLEHCENLLSNFTEAQENEVPDEELQSILNDLNNLYESVIASSLSQTLKQSILDLIQEIRQAIHLYRVKGAEAFREAITKSMGIILANRDAFEENKDSSDVQSVWNMLVRIDKWYTFAVKMKPMLEAAANIFPALAAHIK